MFFRASKAVMSAIGSIRRDGERRFAFIISDVITRDEVRSHMRTVVLLLQNSEHDLAQVVQIIFVIPSPVLFGVRVVQ